MRRTLILASASPRRADLLRGIGLRFRIRPAEVDETPRPGEAPGRLAARLARAKSLACEPRTRRPALVIAADTVVTLDGLVLGKPADRHEARRMLRRLAGRTHDVITAIALRTLPEGMIAGAICRSRVTFAPMRAEEIDWYAATDEGLDKAGGYALQGIGALFVRAVRGSYTNVIGLPLDVLYPLLRDRGLLPARARRR